MNNTLRICFAFVLAACSISAEESENPSVKVPKIDANISAVASSATCRIIIVEGGFDPLSHTAYLQWIREPRSEGQKPVILATKLIKEISNCHWRLYDPKFDGSTLTVLTVTGYHRYGQRPHTFTITLSSDGSQSYTFKGDMKLKEDEL